MGGYGSGEPGGLGAQDRYLGGMVDARRGFLLLEKAGQGEVLGNLSPVHILSISGFMGH